MLDTNPVSSINGPVSIMSEKVFNSTYPKGAIPKKSKQYGKTFICRRGLNSKTTTYTDEIVWEGLKHSDNEEVIQLIEFVDAATKGATTRKRKYEKRIKADEDFKGFVVDDGDLETELGTPKKKRKHSSVTSTPRKPRTPSKLLTPSHKR